MKRIWKYITRNWDEVDADCVHPRMKILPLYVWKAIANIVLIGIIYNYGSCNILM